MRLLNSVIISALFVIASNSIAYAGAIAGTTGAAATRYDVTVTKVELCQEAACTNTFTLGQTTKTFDIASASAGADVGNYISLKGIPKFRTWSHVRATLSTDFSITADDGTCKTTGGTSANRGAWAAGVTTATVATVAPSVLKLPNSATVVTALGAGFNYTTYGITQTDDATSFTMTIALSSPYTCIGKMPRVEIKFDTSAAFGHDATCTIMFPQPPTITITASDP